MVLWMKREGGVDEDSVNEGEGFVGVAAERASGDLTFDDFCPQGGGEEGGARCNAGKELGGNDVGLEGVSGIFESLLHAFGGRAGVILEA